MSRPATQVARVERCRACHGSTLRQRLVMDPMPLAGEFSATRALADIAERYPLTWVDCAGCGLVQVIEDIDDRLLYGKYNYASSTVAGLVRHFTGYAEFLAKRYGAGPLRLLEIGCNDGVLLRQLPATWKLLGVDPSDVAMAAKPGPYELVNAPFGSDLAGSLPGTGSFDVVTGSNCLAHISDLLDVFRGVHTVLRPGGEFFLEVHDLEATLGTGQWDTIYHEHKVEWSEASLARALAPLGFAPSYIDRLPLHGGLLRAGFRKTDQVTRASERPEHSFDRLLRAYRERRDTPAVRAVLDAQGSGRRVAAYGAAGRANVWFNQLPELRFDYVVDDSPARSGRWIPAVGIPIVPAAQLKSRPPDVCVITAWNYAADIKRQHGWFGGTWMQSFS